MLKQWEHFQKDEVEKREELEEEDEDVINNKLNKSINEKTNL